MRVQRQDLVGVCADPRVIHNILVLQPLVTTASSSAPNRVYDCFRNLGEDDASASTNNASAADSVLASANGSAGDDSTGVPYEALTPGLAPKST